MTGTANATIAVGTRIVCDGQLWEVAELAGGAVVLRDALGSVRQADIGHLLAQPGTRLPDHGTGPDVLVPALGADELTASQTGDLRALTGHVLEVLTGYRRGSGVLALPGEPRPPYASGTPKLERYQAKAAELGVSVMTVRRMIWRFEADGPEGLIGQRTQRRKDLDQVTAAEREPRSPCSQSYRDARDQPCDSTGQVTIRPPRRRQPHRAARPATS